MFAVLAWSTKLSLGVLDACCINNMTTTDDAAVTDKELTYLEVHNKLGILVWYRRIGSSLGKKYLYII